MKPFLLTSIVGFCATSAGMPLLVGLSRRLGAVSEVGGRHLGAEPIGRLGGLGALGGVVLSLLVYCNLYSSIQVELNLYHGQIFGLLLGLFIVSAVGFLDDIKRLSAKFKLLVQIIAAIVSYLFGLRISGIDLPFLEPINLGWFGLPITVIWIVGVINAVNLIDGLDGLAGGVILFASIVNFTAAVSSGALFPAALMASIFGSILGFLLYNWYPAKIYLGDGGAYGFGFLLSVSGLLAPGQKASTSIALLVPVLSAGLPIFDTFLTIIRRYLKKREIFSPDRGHLHHRLLDAGISHERVVLGLYLISCALASIALLMVLNRNPKIGCTLLMLSIIGGVVWGGSVKNQIRATMNRSLDVGSKINSEEGGKK